MFSNLLVLDSYHGPFAGNDEVQTLVDENNHWFWAHRISQIYRLSNNPDASVFSDRADYISGTRSPCAFIPLNDNELEYEHCNFSAIDDGEDHDLVGEISSYGGERSLRSVLPIFGLEFVCAHS
jgi:hypothetical protein